MKYLSILDYALLPIVIGVVYALAIRKRARLYPAGHPWRPYFLPGLSVKIFGALFIGLVYAYYYGGGDTFNYYTVGQVINSSFSDSAVKWINLLLHLPDRYDPAYYEYISQIKWYHAPANYTVSSITALICMFTFNTYLPAAVIFGYISFSGVWALFRTFAQIYPKNISSIAVATLFIPSCFVWGSGIFKDTLCLYGLGWLTFSVFRFLIQKDFTTRNIFLACFSFLLIGTVKIYILLAFLPALVVWILFIYTQKIPSSAARFVVKFLVIGITAGLFFVVLQQYGAEYLGKYSLENIEDTAEATRRWITFSSERSEGSTYDLGGFDPSITGMLTKFPLAVNVTLFRPYLWESGKVIILLSGIEAFLFLFLTLKVIFVIGLRRVWQTISKDPTIQFCLIFTLIFAFAVGISSYNFGALSRYKIPCLPFYILAVSLIFYKNAKPGKRLLGKIL